jgi:threonine/homoserine/homoserine lactone efflux protein
MIFSALNLLLIGLIAGFVFSIPVAGPIAVLVVTNSLKNRARFVNRVAIGASIVEFFYVFLAMFGITALIKYYQPFIPYLFIAGGIILILVGIRISKTRFSIDTLNHEKEDDTIDEEKGGLRRGMILNITNPTLFFGWLTSSFLILSFAASLGMNTGGMEKVVGKNVAEISKYTEQSVPELKEQIFKNSDSTSVDDYLEQNVIITPYKATVLSIFYAIGISTGGFIWFYFFGRFIRKHRQKIDPTFLNISIRVFSLFMVGLAVYFFYLGTEILFF